MGDSFRSSRSDEDSARGSQGRVGVGTSTGSLNAASQNFLIPVSRSALIALRGTPIFMQMHHTKTPLETCQQDQRPLRVGETGTKTTGEMSTTTCFPSKRTF